MPALPTAPQPTAALQVTDLRRESLASPVAPRSDRSGGDRASASSSSPASSVGPAFSTDAAYTSSVPECVPVLYQRRASLHTKAMSVAVDLETTTAAEPEPAAPAAATGSFREWTAGCTQAVVKCGAELLHSSVGLPKTAWQCSSWTDPATEAAALGLADFVAEAEGRLALLPPHAAARAALFREALQHAVLSRNLSSEVAATMRTMPYYVAARALEVEALDQCDALRLLYGRNIAAALPTIMPLARDIGDRLVALVRNHLQLVAQQLRSGAGVGRDLLPEVGSALRLDPKEFPLAVCALGSGVCAIVVVALLRLRRVFSALTDLNAEVFAAVRTADGSHARATAAASRAVRRDICLRAGTCTNQLMEPFYQVVQQLMVLAVA
eukprot:EG_transcript_5866